MLIIAEPSLASRFFNYKDDSKKLFLKENSYFISVTYKSIPSYNPNILPKLFISLSVVTLASNIEKLDTCYSVTPSH